jgi:hypothetical protein
MCIFYFPGCCQSGRDGGKWTRGAECKDMFEFPAPPPPSIAEVMVEVWMSCLGHSADKKEKIGDKGAKILADALKANSSIKVLDLHGEYGGKGAEGSGG